MKASAWRQPSWSELRPGGRSVHDPRHRPADALGGGLDVPVADMGVAQRHLHLGVAEQTGHHRQRNAPHRRLAGKPVPQIVRPDIDQTRFRAHVPPEFGDFRQMARVAVTRGKDPCAFPRQPVGDLPRGGRQPDRARPVLAVAKEELAFPVVPPLEGQELALAAPRQ